MRQTSNGDVPLWDQLLDSMRPLSDRASCREDDERRGCHGTQVLNETVLAVLSLQVCSCSCCSIRIALESAERQHDRPHSLTPLLLPINHDGRHSSDASLFTCLDAGCLPVQSTHSPTPLPPEPHVLQVQRLTTTRSSCTYRVRLARVACVCRTDLTTVCLLHGSTSAVEWSRSRGETRRRSIS
jgi:hypothetical protein